MNPQLYTMETMRLSQTILVCFSLLLVSCSKEPVAPSLSPGGPKLLALYPSQTVAGVGFNVQPGGVAALALGFSNLPIRKVSFVFSTNSLPTSSIFLDQVLLLAITG